MAAAIGSPVYFRFLAISQSYMQIICQIWHAVRYCPYKVYCVAKYLTFAKLKMPAATILNLRFFGYISVVNVDIFLKFGTLIAIGHRRDIVVLGKIQDGGGRHLEFSIVDQISVLNEDIFVKFGTLTDIDHIKVTVAQ